MPRTCSVCVHPQRQEVDRELVAGEPYRAIAQRFAASPDAVFRHRGHLPIHLVKAAEAEEATRADALLAQLRDLQATALRLLSTAEQAGDLRAALMGVREARACLELLAKLLGELDERPSVNLLVAPEWLQVRAAMTQALGPHPEAARAVAERLAALEAPR